MMSLNAAPAPVTMPLARPFCMVRCMHKMPTGPMGADAIIPTRRPLSISNIGLAKSINMWFIYRNRVSIYAKLRIIK